MSCIGLCGKGRIMIKVAFCDDDLSVLKELSVLMDRYRVERNSGYYLCSISQSAGIAVGSRERDEAGYYFSGCSDAWTEWNQYGHGDPSV